MTSAPHKIVITGCGGLSAAGDSISSMWESITTGKSGIGPIKRFGTEGFTPPLGGEIKDYDPKKLLTDRKLLKLISRHDVLGLNAADQALKMSGLIAHRDALPEDAKESFNYRTGLFVGSASSKYSQQYDYLPTLTRCKGEMSSFGPAMSETVNPMWLLRVLPNNVLAHVSMQYGINGENQNVMNHVVSGFQAVLEAYYALQTGRADRAVAIAYDAEAELHNWIYYHSIGILSDEAIRSFDSKRNGTLLAEGAGALVLETEASALARGATIYGELLGGAATSEAGGCVELDSEGEGLVRTIQRALKAASVDSKDVGLIVAHGNGTKLSDETEAKALNKVFSKNSVPVTGFKWALGHTFAASGALESALMLQALKEGMAPGIATLEKQAEECSGIAVSRESQKTNSSIGMILGRGFFGQNAALVLAARS